jgi:hypothetical protein
MMERRLAQPVGTLSSSSGCKALQTMNSDKALANAEKIGCRTGENVVTICNMRLRLL